MTPHALVATIERAQRAVDDDDPDFAGQLRELADAVLPGVQAAADDPAFHPVKTSLAALFVAIRKLRPCPIWVEGPLASALAARDAHALDGVLVRGPAEHLPANRGREAYWTVSAHDETARWAHVPAGFGVVIAAPDPASLPASRIADARRLLRGRSLGVLTGLAHAEAFRGAGLDVLVLEGAPAGVPDGVLELAPRVMCRALGVVRTSSAGVIVPVAAAGQSALYLAGHRAGRPLSHDPG